MQGSPEYAVDKEHVLELVVNTPDAAFGRIYRVRNRVYREMGIVTAFKKSADAETFRNHWCAECYLTEKSYSDAILDGLGQVLLAETACTEPLMVNLCFGERTDNRHKTFGKVCLDED